MTLTAYEPVLQETRRTELTMVWAASSEIENLQWQLDRAQMELKGAIRAAFHNGAEVGEIAPAADLDADEVQALLQS